ncbi:MAG: hypothetical protein DI585_03345 [Pseudomonas fluorescens]|nr:MAG: hypothetical protein DI585_03345 [Pseudomonas fluorescens]
MLNRELEDYDYFYFLKQEPGLGHNAPPAESRRKPKAVLMPLPQPSPAHDKVPEYTSSEALLYWQFKTFLRRCAIHGLPAIDRQRYERLLAR